MNIQDMKKQIEMAECFDENMEILLCERGRGGDEDSYGAVYAKPKKISDNPPRYAIIIYEKF